MTDEIIVGASGPTPEEDIADGAHPLILIDISEPETIETPNSPYGKSWTMRRWTFKVNQSGSPYDGRKVETAYSLASGKNSNTYAALVALNNGQEIPTNTRFGLSDLIGRMAIGTIGHDEPGGWPRIRSLSAIPQQFLQQQVAAAVQPPQPQQPLREQVAAAPANADDLPF